MRYVDALAIGRRVREKRRAWGLTQTELALMIDTYPAVISWIETAGRQPTLEQVLRLAEYFEVTTDWLLMGD